MSGSMGQQGDWDLEVKVTAGPTLSPPPPAQKCPPAVLQKAATLAYCTWLGQNVRNYPDCVNVA